MEGILVDKVPEKENEEVENTSLSLSDPTNVQSLVRQTLEKKGYNISRILDELIDVAENAYTTPRGEGGTDFGKRLKALELMMEAAGYTKKGGGVEVKFSLNKLVSK